MKRIIKKVLAILLLIAISLNLSFNVFAYEDDSNTIKKEDSSISTGKDDETEKTDGEKTITSEEEYTSTDKEDIEVNKINDNEKDKTIDNTDSSLDINDTDEIEEKDENIISGKKAGTGSLDNSVDANSVKDETEETEEIEENLANIDDGIYSIQSSINSNLLLEVENESTANKANVKLATNTYIKSQRFQISKLEDNCYKIIAIHSKKSIEAENNEIKEGINVQQNSYSGNENQKWIIKETEDYN